MLNRHGEFVSGILKLTWMEGRCADLNDEITRLNLQALKCLFTVLIGYTFKQYISAPLYSRTSVLGSLRKFIYFGQLSKWITPFNIASLSFRLICSGTGIKN